MYTIEELNNREYFIACCSTVQNQANELINFATEMDANLCGDVTHQKHQHHAELIATSLYEVEDKLEAWHDTHSAYGFDKAIYNRMCDSLNIKMWDETATYMQAYKAAQRAKARAQNQVTN